MKLKSILSVLLFSIIFLFVLNSDCFAIISEDIEMQYNYTISSLSEENKTLLNSAKSYIVFEDSGYLWVFYALEDGTFSWNVSNYSMYFLNTNKEFVNFNCLRFKIKESSLSQDLVRSDVSSIGLAALDYFSQTSVLDSCYGNVNVVSYSDNENVLFQAPPQVVQVKSLEEVAKETLEKKEVQETLLEILKKILVTIVGLIGFWKAYCFLLKQLRNS